MGAVEVSLVNLRESCRFEVASHFAPSPVKPAHHRADWYIEQISGFLIAQAIEIDERDDSTMVSRKC